MGKRILRPGGGELTQKSIDALGVQHNDDVLEFAPGFNHTATLTLKRNPATYAGIELSDEAAAILKKSIHGNGRKIIIADAAELRQPGLPRVSRTSRCHRHRCGNAIESQLDSVPKPRVAPERSYFGYRYPNTTNPNGHVRQGELKLATKGTRSTKQNPLSSTNLLNSQSFMPMPVGSVSSSASKVHSTATQGNLSLIARRATWDALGTIRPTSHSPNGATAYQTRARPRVSDCTHFRVLKERRILPMAPCTSNPTLIQRSFRTHRSLRSIPGVPSRTGMLRPVGAMLLVHFVADFSSP